VTARREVSSASPAASTVSRAWWVRTKTGRQPLLLEDRFGPAMKPSSDVVMSSVSFAI